MKKKDKINCLHEDTHDLDATQSLYTIELLRSREGELFQCIITFDRDSYINSGAILKVWDDIALKWKFFYKFSDSCLLKDFNLDYLGVRHELMESDNCYRTLAIRWELVCSSMIRLFFGEETEIEY